MKLTYEQYRMLAQLGPSNDRIILKNKKGQIIKPSVNKWDQNLKETRFTSMAVPPKPFLAPTVAYAPLPLFIHLRSWDCERENDDHFEPSFEIL